MTIVFSDKIIKSYSLLVQVKSPKLTGAAQVINETSTPIPGGTVEPSNVDPSSVESENSLGNDQDIMYAVVIVVAIFAVIVALLLIQRRKSTTIQNRFSEPKKQSKNARC